jgi:hypothetical protein
MILSIPLFLGRFRDLIQEREKPYRQQKSAPVEYPEQIFVLEGWGYFFAALMFLV